MSEIDDAEMTLRDYGAVAWRRRWFIVIAVALTVLFAGISSALTTPRYSASADVLVKVAPTALTVGAADATANPRYIENQLTLATGSEVLAATRDVVGSDPSLSVQASENSDIFTFTATSTNTANSAIAANTHAQVFIEAQRTAALQEYEIRKAALEEQLAAIDRGEISELRRDEFERERERVILSIELTAKGGSSIADEAVPPPSPYEPTPARTVTLAAVVGLLIGLGAAFLVDYLDTGIRDEDDLERATGHPTLAVIPQNPDASTGRLQLVTSTDPDSPPAEAYRDLRTAVRFLAIDHTLKLVQVTSPRPGDGKTTTAANLAVVSARAGQRTILVDCDLRKPRVHQIFGLDNHVGFTSLLVDQMPVTAVASRIADVPNLVVITSGPQPPDPSELLSGPSTAALLRELSELADVVIVDSAPVLPITDGVVLSRVVDGVIIVVSATTADRRQVARTVQRLASVEANVLGTVLNAYAGKDTDIYRYGYTTENVADANPDSEPDEPRSPAGITTADLFDDVPAAGVPRGSSRRTPDR